MTSSARPPTVTSYGYDAVGSLKSVGYPNGNYSEYFYDALNRLSGLYNYADDTKTDVLSAFEYVLAADGMKERLTETDSLGGQTVIDYEYDALNRLAAEGYDAPGTSDDFTDKYVYDLAGNRKYVLDDANNVVAEYTYNDTDQLTQEVSGSETYKYLYDDNGSLVKKVYGTDIESDPNDVYVYNLLNRLCEFTPNNGGTITYKYDPAGMRVEKQAGAGQPVKYLIDPHNPTGYPQVLLAQAAADANTVYIIGLDIISQAEGPNGPLFFVYDGHGSVRGLADSSAAVTADYYFDAYGNAPNFDAAAVGTKLFECGRMRGYHSR